MDFEMIKNGKYEVTDEFIAKIEEEIKSRNSESFAKELAKV